MFNRRPERTCQPSSPRRHRRSSPSGTSATRSSGTSSTRRARFKCVIESAAAHAFDCGRAAPNRRRVTALVTHFPGPLRRQTRGRHGRQQRHRPRHRDPAGPGGRQGRPRRPPPRAAGGDRRRDRAERRHWLRLRPIAPIEAAIAAAIDEAADAFGGLDIVVSNAGIELAGEDDRVDRLTRGLATRCCRTTSTASF